MINIVSCIAISISYNSMQPIYLIMEPVIDFLVLLSSLKNIHLMSKGKYCIRVKIHAPLDSTYAKPFQIHDNKTKGHSYIDASRNAFYSPLLDIAYAFEYVLPLLERVV